MGYLKPLDASMSNLKRTRCICILQMDAKASGSIPSTELFRKTTLPLGGMLWVSISRMVLWTLKLYPSFAVRKEVSEYMKHMIKLRDVLSELLSEALGLSSDHLARIECMESEHLSCLYYPPCPEPNLTLGLLKHSDTTFFTTVVQDDKGGLQVFHQDQWVNVLPVPGALLANIGDLMQFKSAEHRVLARCVGSRVSTACCFFPSSSHLFKPYGPIKELLSETNPPLYREVSNMEYTTAYQKNVRHRTSTLALFKL
ncbi:1-aminocyclopropane-1-carboxylate oxidase homolog 11-like isoform X2 [Coffea arabica]|uniref:1-aminocyclopropane-1-carboxylate oxidase homolog 11-like isoform X2 n=1 Tax=Coffea arabica TaxID=13443 RepID=A0ABM4X412_COFAR